MWKKVSTKELIDETNKRGQIINAIIELHAPEKIFDDWYCSHCLETVDYETDQATYPCATIQIIIDHAKDQK